MKKNYKVLVVFHRVDPDGYTSAAIVKMVYPDADLLGWNYKDPLPNVDEYDLVILVDVTLNENGDYTWMHKNKHKMIWIDHHFAAIDAVNDDNITGIHPRRKDVKKKDEVGACIYTWRHFFGNAPIPKHVLYCGVYDVFNKTDKYDTDWDTVWNYMLAMDKVFKWEMSPEDKVTEAELLIKEHDRVIEKIAANASVLEEARALKEAKLFEERSTEFVFNGVKAYLLDTVGIKSPGRPAAIMRSKMDHENCIVFQICYQQPNGKYKVSIRVSETCDLDANEIAKSFDEGGGGHEKAAGCDMTTEAINKLK